MREIVIDTETTGLNYKKGDRIIEVACVELINHMVSGNYLQFYCSTNKAISEEAVKIHGLSNSFLNKFQSFTKQSQKFLNFIGKDTLIIHNADFDLGFINHELKLMGNKSIQNRFIDTVLLAKKKLNTRTANLDFLCRKFSIDLSARKFHGALLDCYLLSEVYLELLGGRQTNLELANLHSDKVVQENTKKNNKYKIHKIPISLEEVKKHKEFIANLKNPLWHKIDY